MSSVSIAPLGLSTKGEIQYLQEEENANSLIKVALEKAAKSRLSKSFSKITL